jgi:hypothetical protein
MLQVTVLKVTKDAETNFRANNYHCEEIMEDRKDSVLHKWVECHNNLLSVRSKHVRFTENI